MAKFDLRKPGWRLSMQVYLDKSEGLCMILRTQASGRTCLHARLLSIQLRAASMITRKALSSWRMVRCEGCPHQAFS